MAESVSECIERLSGLSPKDRLSVFSEIADEAERREVAKGLPPEIYAEILRDGMLQNLNRNVLADVARRKGKKPGQAA